MSEPLEQTDPAAAAPSPAASADEVALLRAQNQKLEKNNSKLLDEKNAYRSRVTALEEQNQAKLIADGKGDQIIDALRGTVKEKDGHIAKLESEMAKMQANYQQKEIESAALNVITQAGAISPTQVYSMLKNDLRMQDGKPIALVGGVETDLNQHLSSLKQSGSGWDHNFSGSGARGMGASGSSPNSAKQKSLKEMSLTERILLERDNKPLYEQMRAQG